MRLVSAVAAILLSVCSCAFVTESPRFEPVPEPDSYFSVNVPSKVHMRDGSVVVCSTGLALVRDTLYGIGVRYDMLRQNPARAGAIPLESVVGVERYDRHTNYGAALAAAPLLYTAGAYGGALLWVAIFGSCPTIYSCDGANYISKRRLSLTALPPCSRDRTSTVSTLAVSPMASTV